MLLDALLDQVSLHVADSGDRSSEAKRAKLEEIDEEPAEANRAHLGPRFARWWLAAGSLLASAIADLARQVRPRGRATGLTAGGDWFRVLRSSGFVVPTLESP